MSNKKRVMSWLEGLTHDDWRDYYSDSEVQITAREALALLKKQEEERLKFIGAVVRLTAENEMIKRREALMKDIRDIDGLWCDDITFCQETCGWRSCPRNKQNIRDRRVSHSFSVEIPDDCPKQSQRKTGGNE